MVGGGGGDTSAVEDVMMCVVGQATEIGANVVCAKLRDSVMRDRAGGWVHWAPIRNIGAREGDKTVEVIELMIICLQVVLTSNLRRVFPKVSTRQGH